MIWGVSCTFSDSVWIHRAIYIYMYIHIHVMEHMVGLVKQESENHQEVCIHDW